MLNWPSRVKIAAGSARGLAYLHEDCNDIFHSFTFIHKIICADAFSLLDSLPCRPSTYNPS